MNHAISPESLNQIHGIGYGVKNTSGIGQPSAATIQYSPIETAINILESAILSCDSRFADLQSSLHCVTNHSYPINKDSGQPEQTGSCPLEKRLIDLTSKLNAVNIRITTQRETLCI